MMRICARVYGSVQGVGYRASVHRRISRLAVTGYVRNMPDGSVELDITGEKEAVDAALLEAHEGSPFSSVERMETEEIQGDSGYAEFVIER